VLCILIRMPAASKKASVGGGPGTAVAGGVKSTMTPVFGKRVAGKRSATKRGGMGRSGRSR